MCLCRAVTAQLCLCAPSIAQDAVHGKGRSTLQTHEALSSLTGPAHPCFKLLCSIRQLAAPLPRVGLPCGQGVNGLRKGQQRNHYSSGARQCSARGLPTISNDLASRIPGWPGLWVQQRNSRSRGVWARAHWHALSCGLANSTACIRIRAI